MGNDWYFAKGGRRVGPFTFAQLTQMARSGLLTPDDMVARGENGMWSSAKCVSGLISDPEPPPSKFAEMPASGPNATANPASNKRTFSVSSWVERIAEAVSSKPSSGERVFRYAVFGLILMGLVVRGCTYGKVKTANAVHVSADALTQEWRSNDTATNKKYKDKVVEVRGVIVQVWAREDRIFGAGPTLQVGGLRCVFGRNEEIENLKVGQTVVIRGIYQGGGVLKFCDIRR